MKVLELMTEIYAATPAKLNFKDGRQYYAFVIGGGYGWTYRFPLKASEYPVEKDFDWQNEDFSLVKIDGKKDIKGNDLYYLKKGEPDNKILLLVNTPPGYRGSCRISVIGDAEIIALATYLRSERGSTGAGENAGVLISGPCKIEIERTGRLYGGMGRFLAVYDGKEWRIGRPADLALEAAIFDEE
ncbi:MAG: hypothetical protein ABIK73_07810 [candidate division WOR-3 bacterium]